MHRFLRMRGLKKCVSVHASVFNHFNQERSHYTKFNSKLNRAVAFAK